MPMRHAVVCLFVLAVVVALEPAPAPAAAPEQAGVSAAVRGEVALTSVRTAETRRPASGEEVFLGDAVTTGRQSGLQILLLDESVFTVGERAELVIDRYVYDPDRGTAALSASLLRGGLRFVSGKISDTEPENVELKLPSATIGVRGTIVTTVETDAGAYVFLDGPAQNNDAFQRQGSAEVTAGGQTVTLARSGFATFVPAGGPPQAPFRPDPALRAQIQGAIAGLGGGRQGGEGGAQQPGGRGAAQNQGAGNALGPGNPAAAAGATKVEGLQTAALSVALTGSQTQSDTLAPTVAESQAQTAPETEPGSEADQEPETVESLPASSSNPVETPVETVTETLPRITTIAELDSLSGGVSHFAGSGAFSQTVQNGQALSAPIDGTLEVALEIDFDNRRIFGGNSYIRARAGTIDWAEHIEQDSFDAGENGLAVFGGTASPPDDRFSGSITIFTTSSGIASTASGSVSYDDGSGNRGTGSVSDAPRVSGPAPAINLPTGQN